MADDARHRRLTLFLRAPAFRQLFLATLGSGFGTYLAAIALTVNVFDRTHHSGVWIAAVLMADLLPIFLVGLTLGPLVDRLSRKRLMITADLARLGVFAALPFVTRPSQIVALAAVSGVATGLFRPAVYAGVPNLVDDEDLEEANSLVTGVETLAWTIGPAVGGVLIAFGPRASAWLSAGHATASGVHLAYWLNAATFLLSALLIARIPAAKLQAGGRLTRGYWRDVRDGFAIVTGTPQLRTVLVVWNVVVAGNAALNVAEIKFAKDSLHAGNVGYGVLVAATGVGLTLGSLVAPVVLGRIGLRRLYPAAIAFMGVGALAAAGAPALWVAALLAAVATAGNGAAIVCNQLLVQRGAPDVMRGRAVALLMSSTSATLSLMYPLTGFLTNRLGGRELWVIAGAVYVCGSGVALVRTRAMRRVLDAPLVDRIKAATQA